jgi:transposase
MMPAAYVKAYVKRNKTDAADAEAICEAVTRPTMRFVPIKTQDKQAARIVLKTRQLFVRQRSQTANALRAHMAEMGIIAAAGMASIAKLILVLRDDEDHRLPNAARAALIEMADQIEMLTARIEKLDAKCLVFPVQICSIMRQFRSSTSHTFLPVLAIRGRFLSRRHCQSWVSIIFLLRHPHLPNDTPQMPCRNQYS